MKICEHFQIYGDVNLIQQKEQIAITFGNFDGVHVGHIYLINELKRIANGKPVVVVTFEPHPANFFSGTKKPLLNSLEDRIQLLLAAGVKSVVVQPFNQEFSELTADEFCFWIKKQFNIFAIILGYDFCYGNKRLGNFEHMKSFAEKEGWQIRKTEAFKLYDNKVVSSSFVRQLISEGKAEEAECLLSRPYFLSGVVIQGDQRGRLLGFPTANIELEDILVLPKFGVYACYVEINSSNKLLPAVMNCGVRPTIASGLKLQIEAHILDFSQDIYNQAVKFYIKKFIRGEMKFAGIEQLKDQIQQDVMQVRNLFMDI